MKGHKLNNEDAIKFIFAGNSTSTFLNTRSDNRFTFKVKKAKDSDLYFVSVLTSPDIYTYMGTISNGLYKHGRKSTIFNTAQSVKVFEYVLKNLMKLSLPSFIEIWHEGKCGKCGRTLTVPDSIINGLGPECYKKITKEEKRDLIINKLLS
jgi:hypothetical protein